jgi:hypothetical protein
VKSVDSLSQTSIESLPSFNIDPPEGWVDIGFRELWDYPDSVPAVCDAGGVSEFNRSGKVARAVWLEPDGRRSRRLSLGAAGKTGSTGQCFGFPLPS